MRIKLTSVYVDDQEKALRFELREAFNPSNGWNVVAIEPDRIQTRYHADGAPAWLATIKRVSTGRLLAGNAGGLVSP